MNGIQNIIILVLNKINIAYLFTLDRLEVEVSIHTYECRTGYVSTGICVFIYQHMSVLTSAFMNVRTHVYPCVARTPTDIYQAISTAHCRTFIVLLIVGGGGGARVH